MITPNYREMTPRERAIERTKDIGLAAAIGVTLAWALVAGLAR